MQTNFLVIGSGIAGLNFALQAAKKGKVIIATKKKIIDANTNFAQGGIAAVLDRTDSPEKLVKDTLKAGSYHNKKSAVEFMAKRSRAAIYQLMELGVEFEKEQGRLKLTQEGGHGQRRIAFVGDYTGKAVEKTLVEKAKQHPNITILEDTFALDLIVRKKVCHGCTFIQKNKILQIIADQTILATGGIGQLYQHTTNPKIATGDGIAMGVRAGCRTKDLEFIQFHPTAFAQKSSPMFLLSETLRGEGGKLLNHKNKRFTDEMDSRDKVSKAIYMELKNGPVYLDISHKSKKFLQKRFPNIYQYLKNRGFDLAKDRIPVTPAAHFICGGLITDIHGHTNIKNLFALGEVARTGVHGANRLASNSLLEALVFSNEIMVTPPGKLATRPRLQITNLEHIELTLIKTKHVRHLQKIRHKIQKLMWNYAGIIRNTKLIEKEALLKIKKIIAELAKIHSLNQEIAETRNMAQTAFLILKSASLRKKSMGCHFISAKYALYDRRPGQPGHQLQQSYHHC